MSDLYIGLMSGSSADGIDAVLVDFKESTPKLLATHYTPYTQELRQKILDLCLPGTNEIHRLGELDIELANAFADSTAILLNKADIQRECIKAIGSHGQTIRHSRYPQQRFTLQIGDPNTIAARTGITTVGDFRRKDIALGGQGAPLVPAFHHHLFASSQVNRVIVNIGGIGNVTFLRQDSQHPIIGFDTGPGNGLMDEWIYQHQQKTYDDGGTWAASGTVSHALLTSMLSDDYFKSPPPKSTGREHFTIAWVRQHLAKLPDNISNADVQATLTELTALTITDAIKQNMSQGEIYVCGGGAHNTYLMERLRQLTSPQFNVMTTEKLGVHPNWVEAIAFAWLAYQTMNKRAGNLPSVTGARQAAILGGLYYA